jgi:hypothetical protein
MMIYHVGVVTINGQKTWLIESGDGTSRFTGIASPREKIIIRPLNELSTEALRL